MHFFTQRDVFLSLPDSAQKMPVNILPPLPPEDAGAHGPCIFAISPQPKEDW